MSLGAAPVAAAGTPALRQRQASGLEAGILRVVPRHAVVHAVVSDEARGVKAEQRLIIRVPRHAAFAQPMSDVLLHAADSVTSTTALK